MNEGYLQWEGTLLEKEALRYLRKQSILAYIEDAYQSILKGRESNKLISNPMLRNKQAIKILEEMKLEEKMLLLLIFILWKWHMQPSGGTKGWELCLISVTVKKKKLIFQNVAIQNGLQSLHSFLWTTDMFLLRDGRRTLPCQELLPIIINN